MIELTYIANLVASVYALAVILPILWAALIALVAR
jgi:hypothetical protein